MADRVAFAGFDGLRLFGAVSVMFSHAFLIATNSEDTEPFVRLLGPGNILGLYGVFTFFIISGFLLTQSLQARPSAITYAVNRTLRIVPGFLFCTLITVAVIGPLFSTLPVSEYFSSRETSRYVTTVLSTLDDGDGLPGVYDGTSGTVTSAINGSLWSLHYEALSYVFLLLLWTLAPSRGMTALVAVTLAVLTRTFPPVNHLIVSVAYTLPYFSGGIVMYWIHSRFGTSRRGAVISFVLFVAACVIGQPRLAFAAFGAYLIVFFGERPNFGSSIARKIGDCSYGIYLFGWPAEEMMLQMTKTANPWQLFAMALPLTLALGWISFHLVEKPAMGFRTAVAAWIRQVVGWVSDRVHGRRAAELGAKVAFVVGAVLLLTSEVQWWYFARSMGRLVLGVVAGSILFMAVNRAIAILRR